jgi:glucose/arabinose dehydrogenase
MRHYLILVGVLPLFLLLGGAILTLSHAKAQSEHEWPPVALERVVTGLAAPVLVTHGGDGSGRVFVVEQEGRIRILQDGALVSEPFLNITDRVLYGGERGLLGLAFPPDYGKKGYFYVHYTSRPAGHTTVSRFHSTEDSNLANPESEEILLTVTQPYSNHNGGHIAFGPTDGYLYIALGDGGLGGDPGNRAQNPAELLGKILRIDVESGHDTYSIPADNPFVGDPSVRPEIWALGLRNPWRFSFDRATADLYTADVGQNEREEVNFQPATSTGGENYGWRCYEGSLPYNLEGCAPEDTYTFPVAEYVTTGWGGDCAITGGYVYRGQTFPRMQGTYFYGDYCSGRIWGLRNAGSAPEAEVLLQSPTRITSFGEDEAGELYLVDFGGAIYRLTAYDRLFLPLILSEHGE